MFIDFTNIFIGLLIVISGLIAIFSKEQTYRILGSIFVFLLLISETSIEPFFTLIIFGFLLAHSFRDNFKNIGRYSYVLLLIIVLSSPVLANTHDLNVSSSAGGLPSVVERVELVEEVLLVNQVLEVTNQPHADVKGTDYMPFDIGKLQVYLSIGNFPITNATCLASVLYPNMSFFLQDVLMLEANKTNFEGLYYYDFVVPNVTGVYPVNALCVYDTENMKDLVNVVLFDGLLSTHSLEDLNFDDGVEYNIIDQASCNNNNCSANFTINLPIGWYTAQLDQARILLESRMTKSQTGTWSIFSPSLNKSFFWFNQTTKDVIYLEQFVLNNSFQNDQEIIIVFEGYDFQGNQFYIDYLFMNRNYLGTTVNDLRGNEELVVSQGLVNILNNVNAPITPINSAQLGILLILFAILGFFMVQAYFFAGLLLMFLGWVYFTGLMQLILLIMGVLVIVISSFRNKSY